MEIKTISPIKIFLFVLFFILGGISKESLLLPFAVVLLGLFALVKRLKTKPLIIPEYFYFYLLFLAIFLISIFWSRDPLISYKVFLTFMTGGVIWLFFANEDVKAQTFAKIIICLSLVFGLIFLYLKLTGKTYSYGYNLLWYSTSNTNHLHFGDLWAPALLFPIYEIVYKKKKSKSFLLVLIIGLIFLAASLSRSALLSLAGGILYLFYSIRWWDWLKKKLTFLGPLLIILFLLIGSQKTLLGSRDYWVQSILGLFKYPLGVGVGNFGLISEDPSTHLLGMTSFSNTTHNLLLEFTSGMGYLGIVFIAWFILVLLSVVRRRGSTNALISSIFLAITINFMFNFTYLIPTMLWLWFAGLGVFQSGVKRGDFYDKAS